MCSWQWMLVLSALLSRDNINVLFSANFPKATFPVMTGMEYDLGRTRSTQAGLHFFLNSDVTLMLLTDTDYKYIQLNEKRIAIIANMTMKVVELMKSVKAYGWGPEELHENYLHLSMSQIYSALAYYCDRKAEIDAEIERLDRWAAKARQQAGKSPIAQRIREQGLLKVMAEGVVRVGETRVTLDTVVAAFLEGATAEEIAEQYPSLPLADIYAVIAYYLNHQAEVDAYLQERQRRAAEIRQEAERRFNPVGIRERLLARRDVLSN